MAVQDPDPKTHSRSSDENGTGTDVAELAARCEHLQATCAAAEVTASTTARLVDLLHRDIRAPLEDLVELVGALKNASLEPQEQHSLSAATTSVHTIMGLLDMLADVPALCDDTLQPADEIVFDLRGVLVHAIELLETIAARNGKRLAPDVDPVVPDSVSGDPVRLRQILLFVGSRALHAVPGGELKLTVSSGTDDGTDPTPRPGPRMRVSVRHDGEGLDDAALDEILLRPAVSGEPDPAREDRRHEFVLYQRLARSLGGELEVRALGKRGFEYSFTAALVPSDNDDRRASARRPQALLMCSLGEVADLSLGGMRVIGTRGASGRTRVQMYDWQTTLEFDAEVVRHRRLATRRHEIGLRFVDLTHDQAAQLGRIWFSHSLRWKAES